MAQHHRFYPSKHFTVDLFPEIWYDLSMPSLTPKLIGGHTYYYARYCQRVDGKPKIVRQVYLGKIEDLVAAAEHSLEFEKQMPQPLVELFQLDLRALVYDGTNFFPYITPRPPADLPQRGHNKQKRGDLRQVSLGLLVSADFHIPLFHKVY